MRPDRYEVAAALLAASFALQGRMIGWLGWLAALAIWTPQRGPLDLTGVPSPRYG